MITIEDFKKLEIRIGTVKSVEKIPDTDKLLRFVFDVGNEERQIMAGMAQFFPNPSVLIGKQIPLLLNIQPRKLRGFESQGMIIAADDERGPVLLHPEKETAPGSIVR